MDRLLEGLTEEQRLAVTVDAPRLRILAGAGSGKTRVLTRRIAHRARAGALEPARTLVLTFTRKAAGELRHRLRSLGMDEEVAAGTFHAQAYAALRTRWADIGQKPPRILDRRGRLVDSVLPRGLDAATRSALHLEIDWATARRITPDHYPAAAERAGRRLEVGPHQIGEYYRRFVEEKRRRHVVDFDDLLEMAISAMGDPDYARARQWRFRHVLVDEFQDVNPLQYQLLRSWLGGESTLCVVGDPNQAIYGWNGADASYLSDFEAHFPGSRTVELLDNFRSTPEILAAAAAVLGGRGPRARRPPGTTPTVSAYDDEKLEAAGIARRIRDLRPPGGVWSNQAVLVRTNAQVGVILEALRLAAIPVASREGTDLLDDPAVSRRLLEGESDPRPLRSLIVDLRAEADAPMPDSTDRADTTGDLAPESALALLSLAEDHSALEPEASVADFASAVRALGRADRSDRGGDSVSVVTFHAAKGLEWAVVHIAGLEDGLVPISYALTPEAVAEERRLVYVAMTRARDELHLSWARNRRFRARSVERRPSSLLSDLGSALDPATAGVLARDNVQRVRALRDLLGVREVQPMADDDLRDRLREWRDRTARAASVPAYVVFADRTLDALVRQRPRTLGELETITGLGPVRISRYGAEILGILAEIG